MRGCIPRISRMKNIIAVILVLFFTCIALPAQTTYTPTDAGSEVSFAIKNFGLTTDGHFKGLKGTIRFDPANPAASYFAVSVNAATVKTGNSTRDKDIKEEKYFDVDHHPTLSFKSIKIASAAGGKFNMTGNLTIKGTTRPVQFDFTAKPKEGGYLFEGNFTIDRQDYKVGGNSMSLQDKVKVKLAVQARK